MANNLSKEIKNKISDTLVKKQSTIPNLHIEIGKLLYQIATIVIPREVQRVVSLYPTYFNQLQDYIWLNNQAISYLNAKGERVAIPSIFFRGDNLSITIKDGNISPEVHSYLITANHLLTNLNLASKNDKELKKQIDCVLASINTSTRLSTEFPEAYSIYMELRSKDATTKCDSIEKVRAMLSKASVKTKKFK